MNIVSKNNIFHLKIPRSESILTQVATHKILGVRSPFSLEVIGSPQDFVASNFSLRLGEHNLDEV